MFPCSIIVSAKVYCWIVIMDKNGIKVLWVCLGYNNIMMTLDSPGVVSVSTCHLSLRFNHIQQELRQHVTAELSFFCPCGSVGWNSIVHYFN